MKYLIIFLSLLGFSIISYQLIKLEEDVESVLKMKQQERPKINQKSIPRLSMMPLGNHPKMGVDSAKVKMIIFIDYECSYCYQFIKKAFPQIITEFVNQGKVQVIFKDRPLKFHENSNRLSLLAHMAFENKKFGEFLSDVWTLKKDTSLFYSKFNFKVNNVAVSSYQESIEESVKLAEVAGITGTPTFVINNRVLVGNRSFEELKKLIDYSYTNELKSSPTIGTCSE